MSVRAVLLASTVLVGIGPMAVHAADLGAIPYLKAPPLFAPAVDGFNGKVEGLGGELNGRQWFGYRGAVSMPLADRWGLQVDTSAGSLARRGFASIAPHLFWRNPAEGLIGLYASHTYWNQFGGAYVTQVAGEFERYFGRWTVQGIAGVEFGNNATNAALGVQVFPQAGNVPGVINTNLLLAGFDVKTRFFDQINLKYYFTDNISGYVGHRYLGGKNALALGTEWATPIGNNLMASLFVEARLGERDFDGVWGGLKFYFGQKNKSLIQRHRQDDPPFWDTLHSILNSYHTSGTSTSTQFCDFGIIPFDNSCESF